MKKVLIVDDNYLSAEGIEKNIDWQSLGAEVAQVCYNATTALCAMSETPVDLIISDIEMPDMDGITMGKAILDNYPNVKIILISAYDKFEYAKRALRLGALDYIEKPIDYNYLVEKIQNAFAAADREEKNRNLIRQSKPLLIDKFFRQLLYTPSNDAEALLASDLAYLQLDLTFSFYNVITLELENAREFKETYGIERFQVELLNMRDLIQEYMSVFSFTYLIDNFNGYFCVLGQNSSNPNHFLQASHKILSMLTENCQKTGLSVNAGIGSVVTDLWQLNHSFESSARALEYRFFFPHKNVFDGREALGQDFSFSEINEIQESELIRLICKKELAPIDAWLENFTNSLIDNFHVKNHAFVQIYILLGKLLSFSYELNLDTSDLEKRIVHVYNNMDQFRTSEEVCRCLKELCHLVCQKMDHSFNDYHKKLCDSVISYVGANYMNNTLCLNDIARETNVSPAYLSALFKKHTGNSISDLITTRRIEAACRYLQTTNLTLKEISSKCGYANQYYFSSSFKKKMGTSPSAYREQG